MPIPPRLPLVWLALWVMAFAALAPTVSRLRGPEQKMVWVQVCSSTGTQWLALDTGTGQTAPPAHTQADSHCGYCLLQHHVPVLPVAGSAWVPAVLTALRVRTGSGHSTVFVRALRQAHHPRAPPGDAAPRFTA
jgi:hypothetical protein